ncbi:MAG: DMT family transporter [Caulobacteraceae bacterium]
MPSGTGRRPCGRCARRGPTPPKSAANWAFPDRRRLANGRMTQGRAARTTATLVLIAGAAAIAFAPILVRLTQTGPAAAGFWRLTLALPALAVIAARTTTTTSSLGRPGAGLPPPSTMVLVAGVFFALDLGFWHYGIALTTVADATILANLSPIVVTLAAWLMLRERPAKAFLLGLALAMAGVWAIAAAKGGGGGPNPRLGDALSAATAIWYAIYMLIVRKARADQGAWPIMLWSSAAGIPLLLAAAALLHERIVPAGPAGWLACIGLAVVHVTGQGAIAWALGRLPAATASVVILVQPVLAALLGWLLFAEPMSVQQMAGGAAALAGVALAQIAAAKAARTADAGA